MKSGLSEKELLCISRLELHKQYFFSRKDIQEVFGTKNETNVYLYRLRKKGRIIKLNKDKYYLIPIRAVGRKWSEHPFIIIDEMMNGKNYCIVGKAAAWYWKHIEQIPFTYEVWNTHRHEEVNIFNTRIIFKKRRIRNFPQLIQKKITEHSFFIATKKESKKWI